MEQRKRIFGKRIVTFLLAVALVLPSGTIGAAAYAAAPAAVLEIDMAEILAAMERNSPVMEIYDVDSVPLASVLDEEGRVVDRYPLEEEAVHGSYQLDRTLGNFIDNLTLPYEREEDSVLVRMELLEAMEGKVPVKTLRQGDIAAVAAVEPHSGSLVLYAVNSGGGGAAVRLVVRGAQNRELDSQQVSLLIRAASRETLTEEQLSVYRGSAQMGVEILSAREDLAVEEGGAEELTGVEIPQEDAVEAPAEESGAEESSQSETAGQAEDADVPEAPDSDEPFDAADTQSEDTAWESESNADGVESTVENEPGTDGLPLPTALRLQPMRIGGGSVRAGADRPEGEEAAKQEYVAIVTRELAAAGGDGTAALQLPGRAWAEMVFDLQSLPGETNSDNSHTVTFHPLNGASEWSVVVEEGMTAPEPALPAIPQGMVSFWGWYESNAPEDGAPYDFTTAVQGDLELEARYSEHYVIQYKSAPGEGGKVIHTQLVPQGQSVSVYEPDPDDLELTEGLAFRYWYVENGDSHQPFQSGGVLGDNLVLVPMFNDSYFVIFQSGGSPVDTAAVKDGQAVAKPQNPTRVGFRFSHWSLEPGGEGPYEFDRPVTGNLTLYGVWEGHQDISYTQVYWVEKPNLPDGPKSRADYTYAYSQERKGVAGSTVKPQAGDSDLPDFTRWRDSGSEQEKNNPLVYSAFHHSDETVLSGDGNTLVNIYYNRIPYHMTFELGDSIGEEKLLPGLSLNGRTYAGSSYSITAKYEQDLTGLWPTTDHLVVSEDSGETWSSAKSRELALACWDPSGGGEEGVIWDTDRTTLSRDMIPAGVDSGGIVMLAGYSHTDNRLFVSYRVEMLEQDYDPANPATHIYQGVAYEEITQLSGYIYDRDKSISHRSLEGLEPVGGVVYENGQYFNPILYYKRGRYQLEYNTQGAPPIEGETLVYYQPIKEPAQPTLEGHTFVGWYAQPDYTSGSMDFKTATMPASNLTLYARWDSEDHTVRFYQDKSGAQLLQTQGVRDGFTADLNREKLPRPGDTDPQRGEFLGWVWNQNGAYVQYPSANPVHADYALYGNWKNSGYSVVYNLGEQASGSPVVDGNSYSQKAMAQVQPPPADLTAPLGKAFAGWQIDGTGQTHYPFNLIQVLGNTTMKARYVDIADAATLTYHANGGHGGEIAITAQRGETLPLLGADAFDRDGYTLQGWSTFPGDDNTAEHACGAALQLDSDTTLYAVWEKTPTGAIRASAEEVSAVYSGQAHRLQVQVSGVENARVEYRLPGGDWSPIHPLLVDVSDSSQVEYRVEADGYDPVTGSARVEITPRTLTAQVYNISRAYTGDAISVTTGSWLSSGTLVSGQTLALSATGHGTAAGRYPIVGAAAAVYSESLDVTDNYDITVLDGMLTIEQDRGSRAGGSNRLDTAAAQALATPLDQLSDSPGGTEPAAKMPSAGGLPLEAVIGLGILLMGTGGVCKLRSRKRSHSSKPGAHKED